MVSRNQSIYARVNMKEYFQGSTFQRREFEERLKSHENQSFLAKQRTIPTARKQLPSDPSNSTANNTSNGTNNSSKR